MRCNTRLESGVNWTDCHCSIYFTGHNPASDTDNWPARAPPWWRNTGETNILKSIALMRQEKSGPVVTPAASSSCGDTEHSQRCCTYAIRESGPVITPAASSSCGDTEHSQKYCTYATREVRTSCNTCCQ
ncbi:hypothetical protein J6590_033728 [Homalodisca vitripennis]|nr:hypothetical protein J6590_033728 [Homalodisca vitripennis]